MDREKALREVLIHVIESRGYSESTMDMALKYIDQSPEHLHERLDELMNLVDTLCNEADFIEKLQGLIG